MKHYRFNWDEFRGGEEDHWGKSLWYIEVDNEGWLTRQLEIYENGQVLKYDEDKIEDEYGMLGDQKMTKEELGEFGAKLISLEEFNLRWNEK